MEWVVSIVTGVLLWFFLPRGVVLTRQALVEDAQGNRLHDSWTVQNSGSLPIQIRSVAYVTPDQWNPTTRKFDGLELPPGGSAEGIRLTLTDEVSEIRREDRLQPWREVVIPPGDSLIAQVPTNTSLRLLYRRAGVGGVLERRSLQIDGGA